MSRYEIERLYRNHNVTVAAAMIGQGDYSSLDPLPKSDADRDAAVVGVKHPVDCAVIDRQAPTPLDRVVAYATFENAMEIVNALHLSIEMLQA